MIPTLTRTTPTTQRLVPEQYEVLMAEGGWWSYTNCGGGFYAEMDDVVELPRGGDNYRYFMGWSGDVVNIQRVHKTTEWK